MLAACGSVKSVLKFIINVSESPLFETNKTATKTDSQFERQEITRNCFTVSFEFNILEPMRHPKRHCECKKKRDAFYASLTSSFIKF